MAQRSLMEIFEENELNIATLYLLYAQKIPGKDAFWRKISREEIAHAKSIRAQKDAFAAIIENQFSRNALTYVIDFVREEISRTQQEPAIHRDALNTALRIEQSMLEKKCFDLFTPTNDAAKKVFITLNKETERHVEVLREEMTKNKFPLKNVKN